MLRGSNFHYSIFFIVKHLDVKIFLSVAINAKGGDCWIFDDYVVIVIDGHTLAMRSLFRCVS